MSLALCADVVVGPAGVRDFPEVGRGAWPKTRTPLGSASDDDTGATASGSDYDEKLRDLWRDASSNDFWTRVETRTFLKYVPALAEAGQLANFRAWHR